MVTTATSLWYLVCNHLSLSPSPSSLSVPLQPLVTMEQLWRTTSNQVPSPATFFESDIPPQTWTPAVYCRIISCCEKLGYHTHAAILCQFLQPVDYELAFGILKNNVESMVDSLFVHFWGMTIIEYLICILTAIHTVLTA